MKIKYSEKKFDQISYSISFALVKNDLGANTDTMYSEEWHFCTFISKNKFILLNLIVSIVPLLSKVIASLVHNLNLKLVIYNCQSNAFAIDKTITTSICIL